MNCERSCSKVNFMLYDAEYDHSARQAETGQDKLPSVSDEV